MKAAPRSSRWFGIWFVVAALSLAAPAQPTERHYLSGRGKDDGVPWKFFCTSGALSGIWTNLPVPSNWELHGFGQLNYKKDSTNAYAERGLYVREFFAPKKWRGQRVVLVFEGAMTDTSAQLNGASVGPTHQGGFYRFKYEVTSLVKIGVTNKLGLPSTRQTNR
jgi:beta-galactosidase/beta-glucuronidase